MSTPLPPEFEIKNTSGSDIAMWFWHVLFDKFEDLETGLYGNRSVSFRICEFFCGVYVSLLMWDASVPPCTIYP